MGTMTTPEPYLWLDIPQHEHHVVEPLPLQFGEEALSGPLRRPTTHRYVATGQKNLDGFRQFRLVETIKGS